MGALENICEISDDWFSFSHSETHTIVYNPPQIIDAYFAQKVISKDKHKESGMKSYQFRNNNTITAQNQATVINTYILPRLKETNRFATFESVKDVFPIGYYKAKTSITVQMYELDYKYEKITETIVGSEVYLVAETKYFKDGDNITFKIYESSKMLVEEGEKLPVLKGNSEETEIEGSVVTTIKYINNNFCSVDDKLLGEVVNKIKLRPKEDEDFQDWREKFKREEGDTEDKKDLLYLKVSSTTYESVGEQEFLIGDEFEVFSSCLTIAQLTDIFPNADATTRENVLEVFNQYCQNFEINTPLRVAHFFAQVREEVGSSITFQSENLNYASTALVIFSYFRRHPNEAELYGRTRTHGANQEAIANRAYANRLGNGNIASGDGWNFRGKGFIQLTGRANYQSANNDIQTYAPNSGIDIIENPESILTIEGAMVSSMAYWIGHGLNDVVDAAGWNRENVDDITDVVNYHTESREDRKEHFDEMEEIFNTEG